METDYSEACLLSRVTGTLLLERHVAVIFFFKCNFSMLGESHYVHLPPFLWGVEISDICQNLAESNQHCLLCQVQEGSENFLFVIWEN